MSSTTPPVFGKRHASRSTLASSVPRARPSAHAASGLSPDQAAILAAAHAELAAESDDGPRVVPRSARAALLSGLVVGCALAGFDASGNADATNVAALARTVGVSVDSINLLPGLILMGLLGGARASALTVIAVHRLLSLGGETRHAAYAAGGAAASLALAALLFAFGHPPAHGWVVDAMSGAGAGFFYRVFAGSRPARRLARRVLSSESDDRLIK